MKRIRVVLLVALSMALATSLSCKPQDTGSAQSDPNLVKARYAMAMHFYSTEGMGSDIYNGYLLAGYSDVVFACSLSEGVAFADDALVCWPSSATLIILGNLNTLIAEEGIDVSAYSLGYPVTVRDAVEKWEHVRELILDAGNSGRDFIFDLRSRSPEKE